MRIRNFLYIANIQLYVGLELFSSKSNYCNRLLKAKLETIHLLGNDINQYYCVINNLQQLNQIYSLEVKIPVCLKLGTIYTFG